MVRAMDKVNSDDVNSGQVNQVNAEVDAEQVNSEPIAAGEEEGGQMERGAVNRANSERQDPTPGDVLRTLPTEAERRGTRFVSAQARRLGIVEEE